MSSISLALRSRLLFALDKDPRKTAQAARDMNSAGLESSFLPGPRGIRETIFFAMPTSGRSIKKIRHMESVYDPL